MSSYLVGLSNDAGQTYQISNVGAKKIILGDTGNVFHAGPENPENSLGFDLDFYIQETTTHLWRKVNGVWTELGAMLGVDGSPGNDGTDGTDGQDGADGTKWFFENNGDSPENTLGNIGDYFLDLIFVVHCLLHLIWIDFPIVPVGCRVVLQELPFHLQVSFQM